MLFDQPTNRSFAHEVWSQNNDMKVEAADRNAVRDMESFLGFTADGDHSDDPTVSIRVKIPYQQPAATRHLSFQRLQ